MKISVPFLRTALAVASLLAVSVRELPAQSLPVELNYNPACMLPTDSCSAWETRHAGVYLPEYPGCELVLTYRTRSCPDLSQPGSPHPVEEIIVDNIAWPTPAHWQDSTHPCFNVHDAYGSALTHLQESFLRELFQDVIVMRFGNDFDLHYERDSVEALIFPNDSDIVDEYTFRLCSFGKKTYRVINGLCMATITKADVPFSGIFGRTEEREEKGASVAGDPPQSTTNFMRVRYVPCESLSQQICCVQLLQFCRNPITWETEMTITGTLMGEATNCSTATVMTGVSIYPGESVSGCYDYCLDYHDDYQPGGQNGGDGPDLSGPTEQGRAFRVEEVRYDGPGTATR